MYPHFPSIYVFGFLVTVKCRILAVYFLRNIIDLIWYFGY